MDQQTMVTTPQEKQKTSFPLIDALLLTPETGAEGHIGICTNTTASGQVLNEIEEKYRSAVSVLGTLIVSRDGTERMILNSLVHPTLTYLVLFSEESLTFSPSTNLLQALQFGFDKEKGGNFIKNGVAASAQYPNLTPKILDTFRENIIVLPLFMYKSDYTKTAIENYLTWLKPRISEDVYTLLVQLNSKEKIYYDSLNKLLGLLSQNTPKEKNFIELNVKDFQHLQPPKVILNDPAQIISVPFSVTKEGKSLCVDILVENKGYRIKGENEFLIGYSLMKFLKDKKKILAPLEQLLLGAEMGRIGTEINNDLTFSSFVSPKTITPSETIPLESKTDLVMDKKYYYKVGVKEKNISVMCMAFDLCEEVFELQSQNAFPILKRLADQNRFEDYEMDILHRMDVGAQIGRASIAAEGGYAFIQDFQTIFKANTANLPFVIVDSDSFLDVHKGVLRKIYTEGITEEHGDSWKGLARTASVLAIYRDTPHSLSSLPPIYQQGEDPTTVMRDNYKKQLLRFDHDGSYSYGERTRTFFGFDQLLRTPEILKKDPTRAAIIQRFDPVVDMGTYIEKETGKTKFTHDPCLTHDIFFIKENKLYAFHIARAHNAVNAYPENIFGLYDAYTKTIADALKLQTGDSFMLSNRANILLLTEEQRTKKLLSEPSKPKDDSKDEIVGPYQLGENVKAPTQGGGIAYIHIPITLEITPHHKKIISELENQKGVNTIQKAITYLKEKGVMHNNPVLSQYRADDSDPQGDHLVFFQANVFGKKLHATAVFTNHSLANQKEDIGFCNYISTLYIKGLDVAAGDITIFYVNY